MDGTVRSKVVHTSHKAHGGRGEAAQELVEFIAEIEREKASDGRVGARKTLVDLMKEYIAHSQRVERAPATVENYRMVAKRIADPIASIRLVDLTPHDLDQFYGSLDLAANTIRQTHASIKAALAQAVKWGWISGNPAVGATPPKRHRPKRSPLSMPDIATLVRTASAPKEEGGLQDIVLAMAIMMAAMTSARRGELCGLRWDDIDAKACTVKIERQWVAVGREDILSPPKSDVGTRTVVLGPLGLALIERYRELMRDLVSHEPFGWLLSPTGDEVPMVPRSLGNYISDLGRKAKIPVTTHSFRRVTATELVAAGVDVDTSARRMGHTTQVMLEDYVLGADDKAVAAALLLEARFTDQGLPLSELLPYRKDEP